MDCIKSSNLWVLYVLTSLFWFGFTSLWIINSKFINSQYTKSVHFIISFVLVFKSFYSVFSFSTNKHCIESISLNYYKLGQNSGYTLYSTFFYTVLILISKGLSLTRNYLERQEISFIALLMGLIYLGFSAYTIDKHNLKFLVVLILCIIWYSTYKNTVKIIKGLKNRYLLLNNNNLYRTLQAIMAKIDIMVNFSRLANFLFISQIVCIGFEGVLSLNIFKYNRVYDSVLIICSEILESVCIFGICVLFIPKYRGTFFEITELEGENEIRGITPMFKAGPPSNVRETSQDMPFVLINPSEPNENAGIYTNLMIALPVQITYRAQRVLQEDMRVPLL